MKKLYVYKPKLFEPLKFHNCPSLPDMATFFQQLIVATVIRGNVRGRLPHGCQFSQVFLFKISQFWHFFFRQITLHSVRLH